MINLGDIRSTEIVEVLISEVAKRPLLWAKSRNDYRFDNRRMVDDEWENIAAIMDRDKDVLRYKWRNLSNQFHREAKKIKFPYGKPVKPYMQYYRGRWIHFESMLFLIDNEAILDDSISETNQVNIKEEEITIEEHELVPISSNSISESSLEEKPSTPSIVETVETINTIVKEEKFDDGCTQERNRKYSESLNTIVKKEKLDDEYTQELKRKNSESINTIVKKEKLDDEYTQECLSKNSESHNELTIPAKTNKSPVDDQIEIDNDLYFARSLVPYFVKLTPQRKIIVRNEIINILIRENQRDDYNESGTEYLQPLSNND